MKNNNNNNDMNDALSNGDDVLYHVDDTKEEEEEDDRCCSHMITTPKKSNQKQQQKHHHHKEQQRDAGDVVNEEDIDPTTTTRTKTTKSTTTSTTCTTSSSTVLEDPDITFETLFDQVNLDERIRLGVLDQRVPNGASSIAFNNNHSMLFGVGSRRSRSRHDDEDFHHHDDDDMERPGDRRYVRPTLVQSKCIPLAMNDGRDLLVRARTGSGKTLAYAIPLLQKVLSTTATTKQQREQGRGGGHGDNGGGIIGVVLVPTRELCKQTYDVLRGLTRYCGDAIVIGMLSIGSTSRRRRKGTGDDDDDDDDDPQTRDERQRQDAMLRDGPNIIVATPGGLLSNILRYQQQPTTTTHPGSSHPLCNIRTTMEVLVVDEADLVLSFGHSDDMNTLIQDYMPKIYQGFLMSATLSTDVDSLKKIVLHSPVTLKLEDDDDDILDNENSNHRSKRLKQFYVPLPKKDKFLVTYVFLKLGLLRGKGIFFVNDINTCYQLKLLLEQFHIVSVAICNAELPFYSRMNIIEQYNLGTFDYLITTDEATTIRTMNRHRKKKNKKKKQQQQHRSESKDDDDDDEDKSKDDDDKEENQDEEEEMSSIGTTSTTNSSTTSIGSSDYSMSRGLDFYGVSFVVNFDFPTTVNSYIHRIGRTARGRYGRGIALSFVEIDNPRNTSNTTSSSSGIGKGGYNNNNNHDLELLREVQDSQPKISFGNASSDHLRATMPNNSAASATTAAATTSTSNVATSMADNNTTTITTSSTTTTDTYYEQSQPVALDFDLKEIEGFRYRVDDVSKRCLGKGSVKYARTMEIKKEILNSIRLQKHFYKNHPNDLQLLRHDQQLTTTTKRVHHQHLKHIPDYLLPRGMNVMDDLHKSKRNKRRNKKRRQKQFERQQQQQDGGGGDKNRNTTTTATATADPLRSFDSHAAAAANADVDLLGGFADVDDDVDGGGGSPTKRQKVEPKQLISSNGGGSSSSKSNNNNSNNSNNSNNNKLLYSDTNLQLLGQNNKSSNRKWLEKRKRLRQQQKYGGHIRK